VNYRVFYLITLLLCGLRAFAAPPLDIIFDIDWTLVYILPGEPELKDPSTFSLGDKWYRYSDDAGKTLARALAIPGARVSFFSGGDEARNLELLNRLKLPDGRSAREIAFKILSVEDLTPVSTDRTLKFAQRYRKDISRVAPDLQRAVLIDDVRDFSVAGQERNMLWLGNTYEYIQDYDSWKASLTRPLGPYDPPNREAWERERKKLSLAMDRIEAANQKSAAQPDSFLNELHPVPTQANSPCWNLFALLGFAGQIP
jgi:hypothetical protein